MANWETRRGVKGFLAKFLLEKAQECWNTLDLQAFEEILALLIYGLVLFPNPDQFIDVNAIKVFISRNLVPTFLGDILHFSSLSHYEENGNFDVLHSYVG